MATLYTVTAGKTLYLFEVIGIVSNAFAGVADFTSLVSNAADVEQYKLHWGRVIQNANHAVVSDFACPKIIPAGWKIRGSTSQVTCNLIITIHGYEV